MHALMSISTNEYTGQHASRRGNSILIVLILSIKHVYCRCQSKRAGIFCQPFYSQVENVWEKTIVSGHLHNQWPFVPSLLICF